MSQSPRSANEPMAFTDAELLRGAFIAGLTFVLAAPLVAIVVTIASPHDPQTLGIAISVILIATLTALVPITVLTLIVMTPIARAIGRRLRREPRRWPHLLAFGGLGVVASAAASAVVGLLMWAATSGSTGANPLSVIAPIGLLLAPIAGGSAAWGWWRASRRALARDRVREAAGQHG